jgi:MFS family permease
MTYFWLLVNTLLIELAMNLPIGSLPLVLEHDGAARSQIAMAMGVGMLTSVFVSLPIGALVDRIGRILTMKLAVFGTFFTLTLLWLTHGAVWGGILMGMRSISMIAFMTAQAAYISVFVPKERSVSAVATVGIMGNLAFATAPAFAVWLWQHGCGREQYLAANAIMMLAAIFLFFLPKEEKTSHPEQSSEERVILRKEWLPAIVYSVAGTIQAGVNVSLAVLAFHDRGIVNGAILFTVSALTTFVFRYGAGRAVELFGPRIVAVPTAIAQAAGCVLAAQATSMPMVIAAGVCFGIGWAAIVPVVLAIYFEESSLHSRGAAMGSFHFAFGLGAALGAGLATLTSWLGTGYGAAMMVAAATPFVGLFTVLTARKPIVAEEVVIASE